MYSAIENTKKALEDILEIQTYFQTWSVEILTFILINIFVQSVCLIVIMDKYKINSIPKVIWRILIYLTAIFVILDCYSVISIAGDNGNKVKIVAVIFAIISTLAIRLVSTRITINLNILYYISFLLLYNITYGILGTPSSIVQYLLVFSVIPAIMLFLFDSISYIELFMSNYDDVMFFICSCSLIFYFMGSLLKIIPPSGTIAATWGSMNSYKNYYYLYQEAQGTWFMGVGIATRNIGIFTEAPMFAYCTCFAFWYELYRKKTRKIRLIVFFLAIITAFSVTGTLFIGLLSLIYYFKYLHDSKKQFTLKKFVLLIGLIVSAVLLMYLLSDKVNSVSGSSRYKNIFNAFRLWNKHPLLGIGYRNDINGYASGILLALVENGILGILPMSIMFITGAIKSIYYKNFHMMAFIIGFFAALALTVVPYKIITLILYSILSVYVLKKGDIQIIESC